MSMHFAATFITVQLRAGDLGHDDRVRHVDGSYESLYMPQSWFFLCAKNNIHVLLFLI